MAKAIVKETEKITDLDMRIFDPNVILDKKFFDIHGKTFTIFKSTLDMALIMLFGQDKETSPTGEEIIGIGGKNGIIAKKSKELKRKKKIKNKNKIMSELRELMYQDTSIRKDIKRILDLYSKVINKYCIVDEKESLINSLNIWRNQF